MQKLIATLQTAVKVVCTVALALMSTIVLMQVIDRNIFHSSFQWVEELAGMCMVWITFLGAALATSLNSHTRIELFVNLLPGRLPKMVFALGDLVCAGFSLALCWYCWPLIQATWHSMTPAMRVPVAVNYVLFFVSASLIAFFLLVRCASGFQEAFRPAPAADEGKEG